MKIAEIFGPTIQGEGSVIGIKTMFIRVAGCDYKCKWCDSKFAWNSKEFKDMSATKIINELIKKGGNNFELVTITGGNPCVVGDEMAELLAMLNFLGIGVHIETQGSIWQDWLRLASTVTLSPKPPSSGYDPSISKLEEIVENLEKTNTMWDLKMVVMNDEDYEFAKKIYHYFEKYEPIFTLQVGNEDVSSTDLNSIRLNLLEKLSWLTDKVLNDTDLLKVTVLPQLHTLIWGNVIGK